MAWTAPATKATGDLITAAAWNEQIPENMKEVWRRLAHVEITADVAVSGSEAAPNDVVSAGAIVFTGEPVRVEFSCSQAVTAVTAGSIVGVSLWDDATDLGRMGIVGDANGTESVRAAIHRVRQFTPTAASHTYKIRAWRLVANGTISASAHAAAGDDGPAHITIWQKGGA